MKACPRCGETKPYTDFYKCKRGLLGLQSYCKYCKRKYRYVRQLKPWGTPEKPKPVPPALADEFKQFLFLLTLGENKQKVYRENARLSIEERLIIIQMNRRGENEWKAAA